MTLVPLPRNTRAVVATAVAAAIGWLAVRNTVAPTGARFNPDHSSYMDKALHFGAIPLADLPAEMADSGIVGPLVPLLSRPFLEFSDGAVAAMLIQPILHVVAAVAIGGMTARLAGRRAGIVAAVIAAGMPEGLASAASYHLTLGASAFLSLTAMALLASDRGHRRATMIGFGAAAGALLLTRVVSAAFVPGIVIGTLIFVRRTRAATINVGLATATCLLVALPWWWGSHDAIFNYVTDYGFRMGNPDVEGPSSPVLRFVMLLLSSLIYVRPLLVLPAAAVCVAVARRLWIRWRGGWRPQPLGDEARGILALVAMAVAGFATLAGTRNMGDAFTYPLFVLLIAPIVAAGGLVGGRTAGLAARFAVTVSIVNFALIPHAYRSDSPIFTPEGTGEFLFGGADITDDPKGWQDALDDIVATVDASRPDVEPVLHVVTGETQIVNLSTIALTESLGGGSLGPMSSQERFAGFPARRDDMAVVLIAIEDAPPEGRSSPGADTDAAAAVRSGWAVRGRVELPDGGDAWILTAGAEQQ